MMNMRTNHKSINRALLICFLMVFVLTCIAGCGIVGAKSEGIAESSFRKQMADASVSEVTVEKDLVLEAPVEVSGNKVLVGEGSVTAVGQWAGDNYMFVVPSGSQFTVKGSVTIDAADLAGAIHVAKGATLTVEENAVIKSASAKAHNVLNEGTTTISGGQITGSGEKYAGICSEGTLTQNGGVISGAYNNVAVLGGTFTWTAGTNQDSVRDGIFVSEGAELKVSSKDAVLTGSGVRGIYLCGEAVIDNITLSKTGDSLIKISKTGKLTLNGGTLTEGGYHGIENAGDLLMTGGQVRNNFNSGIVNTGTLEVTGGSIMDNTANKGILNKHAGQATVVSSAVMLSGNKIAISNEDTAHFELANAQIILSSTTNVYAYGGTMDIHDITLGASGSNNVRIVAADVNMKNVQVMGNAQTGSATTHGVLLEGGKLDMVDVDIKNTTGYGIRNKGGQIKAKNLLVSTSTKAGGINNTVQDFTGRPGIIQIDNLTFDNIRYNNIVTDGGVMTVNNGYLAASGTNNIKATGGTLYLNNVDVMGNWTDSAGTNHAVYMTGGTIVANDVNIQDASVTGLRVNGETAVFSGSNVTIKNSGKYAIDQTIGQITIEGLTTSNNYYNVTNNGGTVKLTNSALGATNSNNVRNHDGQIILQNVTIAGHLADHPTNVHAIFVSGGEVSGKDVTVVDSAYVGLRVADGVAKFENLKLQNIGTDAVQANGGVTTLTNVSLESVKAGGIAASGEAEVTVVDSKLDSTVNHTVKAEGESFVTLKDVIVALPSTNERHGVLAQSGDVHMENVTVIAGENTGGAGIRINRETSHVTGKGILISGTNIGISSTAGTSDLYDVTTEGIASHSILASDNAVLTVSDSQLGTSGTNNVRADNGGTININNVTVSDTKKNHAIYIDATGGTINATDVTVLGAAGNGINVWAGEFNGTNVSVSGVDCALYAGGGKSVVSNFSTADMERHSVWAQETASVTILDSVLGVSATNNVKADTGASIVLDGVTIPGTETNHALCIEKTGGSITANDLTVYGIAGSGLRVVGGTMTVTNSHISDVNNNGAYVTGGTLVLDNVTFDEIGSDVVINNSGSAENPAKTVIANMTVEDTDSALIAVHNATADSTVELGQGQITLPITATGIYVEQGSAVVNGGYITGGQYAVRNAASFTMNGGWLYNNIWGLYNEATGEATLNGGNYFANSSGTTPGDIYNAGKLTVSDITVGYDDAGNGTGGVIYQAAGAQPIVLKGTTLGLHTASKPITLVTDPWQQKWGEQQTVVVCDSIEVAMDVKDCFVPGKNDPVLYISRRNNTLELTTLPGGNYIVGIGIEKFESFADAFEYMKLKDMTEATLQVLDSFQLFEAVQIPEGYKITLTDDGTDNHVISCGDNGGHMFTVGKDAQLIITSTNDTVSSLSFDGVRKSGTAVIYVDGGKVTVEDDVTISNAVYGVYVADGEFAVSDSAVLTLNGGTTGIYTAGGTTVISELNTSGLTYNIDVRGGSVTVNSGTLGQSGSNNVLCYSGELTLNNVTVEGTAYLASGNLNAVFGRGGDINLNNVTITGADAAGIRISDANSTVVATNVTISDCGAYSAWVSSGSLEFRGTNVLGITPNNNIVADGTGKVDIYDTLTVSGTTGASHHNIYINGGTVTNHGTLNLNDSAAAGLRVSAGSFISTDAGAKVNIARSANSGIIPSGGKIVIDGLTITESAERNIYMWANTKADVTITNAVLEKAPLDNIFIEDTTGGNKLALNNVQIQGATNGHGINVASGTVTGSDVTITGCSGSGISMTGGTVTLNGANISGSSAANINVSGGELTINGYANGSKSQIGETSRDNITVTGGGTVKFNNVDVKASTSANTIVATGGKVYLTDSTVTGGTYGVLVQADGYAELNNVTISASRSDGIRVNQPTGSVVVNGVQIVNPTRYGISADKGSVKLTGNLAVSNNSKKSWALYAYNGGSIVADAGTKITVTGTQYGLVSHSNSVIDVAEVTITGISHDAVYSDGNNVTTAGSTGVTIDKLSVNGCGRGINAFEKGIVNISGSATIIDNTGIGVEVNTNGNVTTNNLTVKTTKSDATHAHNVKVSSGIITMNGTTVLGQSNSQNVLIDGSNAKIVMNGTVTIGGTDTNNGLRVINKATADIYADVTIKNIALYSINVETNGKLTAHEGSSFNLSSNGTAIRIVDGTVTLRDVVAYTKTGHGLQILNTSKVSVTNFQVTTPGTANTVRIDKTAALDMYGEVVIDGGSNGFYLTESATLTVHDGLTVKNVSGYSLCGWSGKCHMKLSGKLNIESIYSHVAWAPEIVGAISSDKAITVDWAGAAVPADLVAIKFAAGTIAGADEIFVLGDETFGAGYLMWFDESSNVARLTKTVTNETLLNSAINNANQLGLTDLNIVIGGSFAVTDQVDFGNVTNVTISDDGDANTGSTITYNGSNTDIFGLASGDSLTLKGITIDGNKKGQLYVPAGATVNVEDVTVANSAGHAIHVLNGTVNSSGDLNILNSGSWALYVKGSKGATAQFVAAEDSTLNVENADYGIVAHDESKIVIYNLTISGIKNSNVYADNNLSYSAGQTAGVAQIQIYNGDLGVCGNHSVQALDRSKIVLNDVQVQGNASGSNKYGIYLSAATSSVTGDTVTIRGTTNSGIQQSNGTSEFTDLVIEDHAHAHSIKMEKGTMTINGGSIGKSNSNNFNVVGGNVILNDLVTIGGTNSNHGLQIASGAKVTVNDTLIISKPASRGVYNAGTFDASKAVKVEVRDIGSLGFENAGTATISYFVTSGTSKHSHAIKSITNDSANLTIHNADICKSASNNVRIEKGTVSFTGTVNINGTASNNGIAINANTTLNVTGELTITDVALRDIMNWGGTVNISGKIVAGIYNDASNTPVVNVTAPLAAGSHVVVDWAAGMAPTGTAIQFASKEVQEVSSKYITLGSIQAASSALVYADDIAVLRAYDYVVTNETELRDAVAAVAASDSKVGAIQIAADIPITAELTVPAGTDITIVDDGTARKLYRSGSYEGGLIGVYEDAKLTISGTAADMLTIDGGSEENLTGWRVLSVGNGKLYLTNVKVANNYRTTNNRGIGMYATGGTTYITNCTFTNLKATYKTDGQTIIVNGNNATVIIANTLFEDNQSGRDGIVESANGTLAIYNSVFKNNYVGGDAGAVYITGTSKPTVIDGCVFEGNYTTGNSGGAIRVDANCVVTVTNSKFVNNTAKQWAGAIANWGGDLTISNCEFTGNTASTESGGAILNYSSGKIEITDSYFSKNSAQKHGGAIALWYNSNATISGCVFEENSTIVNCGGAIHVGEYGVTVNITGCEFNKNTAAEGGGAMYIQAESGTVTVTDSNFTENSDVTGGGAIYVYNKDKSSTVELGIEGCEFTDNVSSGNGGAVRVNEPIKVSFKNSVFTGNTANGDQGGGALFMQGSPTVTVTGCTFTENTGWNGGAIRHNSGSLTVDDCEFTKNHGNADGGTICFNGPGAVKNSIFTGNTSDGNGGAIAGYNTVTVSGCTFAANSAQEGGAVTVGTGATMNLSDSTFTGNTAVKSGFEDSFDVRVANALNAGGINISGKIIGTIYNRSAHKVNVTGALAADGELILTWKSDVYPVDKVCVSYTTEEIMTASKANLALSEALLSAGYQLTEATDGTYTQILTKAAAAAQVSEETN